MNVIDADLEMNDEDTCRRVVHFHSYCLRSNHEGALYFSNVWRFPSCSADDLMML